MWSLIAFMAFCIAVLVILFLRMGKITEVLKKAAETSPKDAADMATRGAIMLIALVVVVGVITLAVNKIPIEGTVASLLFAIVGYMFGLFTPRGGQ